MSSPKTNELLKDIFAFAVLLTRMGFEDCVTQQNLFVEMLNESGFRTITGKEFTPQSWIIMIRRTDPKIIAEIKEEFGDALKSISFVGESPLGDSNTIYVC